MMELVLFGVGAAGNKAAIKAIESNVIKEDHVHLLNTTLHDVPEKYKVNSTTAMKFGNLLGGCGKEPEKGSQSMVDAISNGSIDLSSMVPESAKAVVIVTSIEGGTGSGAAPIMARYFDMLNIPCHVFAFVGFRDEARGISNSLKFFKELGQTNAILHTIRNDRFIDFTYSHSNAEASANIEFCKQLEILMGSKMILTEQIIDDTDHYKIITTPGYMDIIHINKPFNNTDELKRNIVSAFNQESSMDYDPGCIRLAIIVDGSSDMNESIDGCIDTIKKYTGEPFELYRHFQSTGEDSISIIAGGLAYPEQFISVMTGELEDIMSKVNTSSKSLTEILDNVEDTGEQFNADVKQRKSANDARAQFAKAFGKVKEPKDNSSRVVTSTIIDHY